MNDTPTTLGDLLAAYTAEQCTVIIDAEPQLRAGENVVHVTRVGGAPAAQHDSGLRRAVRRGRRPRNLEDELVWWAGLLGAVRDMDILQAGLTERIAALPPELVLGPVESTVSRPRSRPSARSASDAVDEAMDSERYRKLIALVHAWRSDPPFTPAADAARERGHRATSRRPRRRSPSGWGRPSTRGRPARRTPTSCSTGAQGRQAAPVRGRGRGPALGQQGREDRGRSARTCRTCSAPIRTGSSRRRSCASSAPGSASAPGQNGFTYGLLYAQVVAAGDTLVARPQALRLDPLLAPRARPTSFVTLGAHRTLSLRRARHPASQRDRRRRCRRSRDARDRRRARQNDGTGTS